MSVDEQIQSVGPIGISRFLADHRACNAGLEVFRDEEAALGRLMLSCSGCGALVSYRAAEAWEQSAAFAELALGDVAATISAPTVADSAPASGAHPNGTSASPNGSGAARRRNGGSARVPTELPSLKLAGALKLPTRSDRPPGGRKPWTLPTGYGRLPAGAAVLAGIVLAAGVFRSGDGTTPGQNDALGPLVASAPVTSGDSRYAVNVPEGWVRTEVAGLPGFRSPDGSSTLRVYVASGTRSVQDLLGVASVFLVSRNPEGDLSVPQQVSQNGYEALRVASTHSQGQDVALAVQVGDVSYVVWLKVEEAAPAKEVSEAKGLLASFTPTPVEPTPEPPVVNDPPPDPAPPPEPAPDPAPPPSAEAGAESAAAPAG